MRKAQRVPGRRAKDHHTNQEEVIVMNTTSPPLHVPGLLEEADRLMQHAEVNRTYHRLNRALKWYVNFNRLLVVGDVVDDLASVGIEHRDMSVDLHRRIFGRDRLAVLIDQAGGVGNR